MSFFASDGKVRGQKPASASLLQVLVMEFPDNIDPPATNSAEINFQILVLNYCYKYNNQYYNFNAIVNFE